MLLKEKVRKIIFICNWKILSFIWNVLAGSVAPVATVDETNITANGANEQNIENKPNESESKSAEVKSKIWMDFEDFFVCFK